MTIPLEMWSGPLMLKESWKLADVITNIWRYAEYHCILHSSCLAQ